MAPDPFLIAGREFKSRLIIGTGKYPTNAIMQACLLYTSPSPRDS